MAKKLTKKDRLINYLLSHKKGITGKDALAKFGLYRLSGEIHQLRKQGYNIQTEMMYRNGEEFARYFIGE